MTKESLINLLENKKEFQKEVVRTKGYILNNYIEKNIDIPKNYLFDINLEQLRDRKNDSNDDYYESNHFKYYLFYVSIYYILLKYELNQEESNIINVIFDANKNTTNKNNEVNDENKNAYEKDQLKTVLNKINSNTLDLTKEDIIEYYNNSLPIPISIEIPQDLVIKNFNNMYLNNIIAHIIQKNDLEYFKKIIKNNIDVFENFLEDHVMRNWFLKNSDNELKDYIVKNMYKINNNLFFKIYDFRSTHFEIPQNKEKIKKYIKKLIASNAFYNEEKYKFIYNNNILNEQEIFDSCLSVMKNENFSIYDIIHGLNILPSEYICKNFISLFKDIDSEYILSERVKRLFKSLNNTHVLYLLDNFTEEQKDYLLGILINNKYDNNKIDLEKYDERNSDTLLEVELYFLKHAIKKNIPIYNMLKLLLAQKISEDNEKEIIELLSENNYIKNNIDNINIEEIEINDYVKNINLKKKLYEDIKENANFSHLFKFLIRERSNKKETIKMLSNNINVIKLKYLLNYFNISYNIDINNIFAKKDENNFLYKYEKIENIHEVIYLMSTEPNFINKILKDNNENAIKIVKEKILYIISDNVKNNQPTYRKNLSKLLNKFKNLVLENDEIIEKVLNIPDFKKIAPFVNNIQYDLNDVCEYIKLNKKYPININLISQKENDIILKTLYEKDIFLEDFYNRNVFNDYLNNLSAEKLNSLSENKNFIKLLSMSLSFGYDSTSDKKDVVDFKLNLNSPEVLLNLLKQYNKDINIREIINKINYNYNSENMFHIVNSFLKEASKKINLFNIYSVINNYPLHLNKFKLIESIFENHIKNHGYCKLDTNSHYYNLCQGVMYSLRRSDDYNFEKEFNSLPSKYQVLSMSSYPMVSNHNFKNNDHYLSNYIAENFDNLLLGVQEIINENINNKNNLQDISDILKSFLYRTYYDYRCENYKENIDSMLSEEQSIRLLKTLLPLGIDNIVSHFMIGKINTLSNLKNIIGMYEEYFNNSNNDNNDNNDFIYVLLDKISNTLDFSHRKDTSEEIINNVVDYIIEKNINITNLLHYKNNQEIQASISNSYKLYPELYGLECLLSNEKMQKHIEYNQLLSTITNNTEVIKKKRKL